MFLENPRKSHPTKSMPVEWLLQRSRPRLAKFAMVQDVKVTFMLGKLKLPM